ncbi:MAG: hypothetical protein A2W05_03550 [Candidatus Schekmanbacteria bacterium RBG_16_38_10]|uniref:Glycosyltransferase 2-like domain-containing protein n=1 Tax=Candidatus Schekmanbacteria bacterium RBG_16_38_10 TaxID=1817879 RepID=A0A1F7S0D4_9BACT|nr:MAG: hypothetical protein A2W05_03550 [Candidatus Schekmanbacteria bacterium RBG_16_38_10]
MKIIAIMAVYNEELYLPLCLRYLWEQGIQSYIIDNGSTDRTPEILRSFLGRGVIHVEQFPRFDVYEWEPILRRKEELSYELPADWFIHHDADEICQAPYPYKTLIEGINAVANEGYNSINFDEFVFVPTGVEENYEYNNFFKEMKYYYFFEPGPQHRIKAWKIFGQKINLHSSGGHQVQFKGRRVYPKKFIMRHYMVLSLPHAIRKYCEKVYSEVEYREKGWHGPRAIIKPDQINFPDRKRLNMVTDDDSWNRSAPWKIHAIFEKVQLNNRVSKLKIFNNIKRLFR